MQVFLRLILLGIGLVSLMDSTMAATTDEDMCRNGLFPSQLKNMRIATFAGPVQSRLYFFGDLDGCPSVGAQCQSKSYVVPGDELIVGKQHGDWSCVWYPGKAHETVGWVLNRQLHFIEPDDHPDWNGTWKQDAYSGYISIARKSDEHYVLGNMKWTGAQLDDGSRVEHFGELGGILRIQKNQAQIGPVASVPNSEYDCAADFVRLSRFLIVHDNSNCGGVNVRFDGVYTRVLRRK